MLGLKKKSLPGGFSDDWQLADGKKMQAAGGIISASLLSTPGASSFYKGGLTVRFFLPFTSVELVLICLC